MVPIRSRSLVDLFNSSQRLLLHTLRQAEVAQLGCLELGFLGEHELEAFLQSGGLVAIARLGGQHPGGGHDWVTLWRVGVATDEIGADFDGVERSALGFVGGLHLFARGFGDSRSQELAFDVSGFYIAHTTWDLIQLGSHTSLPFEPPLVGHLMDLAAPGTFFHSSLMADR